MSRPDETTAEQIPAAKSRPARERVLPVAQIYQVREAEAQGGNQAMVTLIIGDERTTPKRHGIRARRADWRSLIAELLSVDAQLRDEVREDLQA